MIQWSQHESAFVELRKYIFVAQKSGSFVAMVEGWLCTPLTTVNLVIKIRVVVNVSAIWSNK